MGSRRGLGRHLFCKVEQRPRESTVGGGRPWHDRIPSMPQLGIVDLGSNNARMVVYEYEPERWYRLVDVIREPVRLGEGLGATGEMTEAAIQRGLETLDLFVDYAAAAGLDQLETIGTSALRDAVNRGRFRRAVAPLGVEVKVLSGEEEARRGLAAVANGFDLQDAWVMDLGGGSAQISRMLRRRYADGASYPLGGVRLTEAFLKSDPPRRSEVKALEAEVAHHLGPVAKSMARAKAPLVVMGGTIRNLARMMQKRRAYPLDLLHGYFLSRAELEEATRLLLAKTARQRRRVPGVNEDRADVILAGALVYRWLRAGERRWRPLRLRPRRARGHLLPPLPTAAPPHPGPARLLGRQPLGPLRARLTAHCARAPPLPPAVRRPGAAPRPRGARARAARRRSGAADIGIAIDFYRHHRHGAYVLESDPLPGFSHREHALLMLLVRYHHGGLPSLEPYQRLAAAGDRRLLARLAVCLRLAESLERSRARRVRDLEVEIADRSVTLRLKAREMPAVEIWETGKHGDLFEHAFGRRLELKRA